MGRRDFCRTVGIGVSDRECVTVAATGAEQKSVDFMGIFQLYLCLSAVHNDSSRDPAGLVRPPPLPAALHLHSPVVPAVAAL